jgi:hypothetical protein
VHVDAQPLAEHAARVAHRRAVDRVADGGGVDDVAVGVSAGSWMCCCTRRTSRSPIS